MRKKTTEEFILESKAKHGNRFDYRLTSYTGSFGKIIIICKKHGKCKTTVNNHLRTMNGGCSKCKTGKTLLNTKEDLIRAFKKVHGNRFDYSKVKYKSNQNEKVIIGCEHHGYFTQAINGHLQYGCFKCASIYRGKNNPKRLSTAEWIKKAKAKHGNTYSYQLVKYTNSKSKVKIICKKHGVWKVDPYSHLIGSGCNKCADIKRAAVRRKPFDKFLKQAYKVHGKRYTYNKTIYLGANKSIIITCSVHGDFETTPWNHIGLKCGCTSCNTGSSIVELSYLDFKSIHQKYRQYKVPNTNYKVDGFNPKTNTVYEFFGDFWHANPNKYASTDTLSIINLSASEIWKKDKIKINTLKRLGYNVEIMWESDWKKMKKVASS
jgi:hypothetical protein